MSVKTQMRKGVEWIDSVVSNQYLRWVGDKPAVLSFLFHTVFDDKDEMHLNHLDPQQEMCLSDYRYIFDRFRELGFEFVNSEQILAGLDPSNKYVNITFDDGYRNNFKVLPLLEEYKVPIDLFVTTENIKNQHCFCYDVIYRERVKQKKSIDSIRAEQNLVKTMRHNSILAYLDREFGENCVTPWGDLDRPMNPAEVAEISKNKWVRIGNHTKNHYLLTEYSKDEVEDQISCCQKDLSDWIGNVPNTFAYPNGNYNQSLFLILQKHGIDLAFTCDFRKIDILNWNKGNEPYRLGRFCFLGPEKIDEQISMFRNDISLFLITRRAFHWFGNLSR